MDITECIKKMIAGSGKSARRVSRELGRSPNYLSVSLANRADIGASNVARIASLLGWRLVLTDGDSEMEVTARDNGYKGATDKRRDTEKVEGRG